MGIRERTLIIALNSQHDNFVFIIKFLSEGPYGMKNGVGYITGKK